MTSPTISRSPSSTFAPGPHRRSHPNLQNLHHLSLAPLTPKYPIDPADYDAYYDPGTSELHTSSPLSHIAALPSPGGILTNSPARSRNASRSASRVRKKAKSHVNIQLPKDYGKENDVPDDELKAHKERVHGVADSELHGAATRPVRSQPHLHRLQIRTGDPSWLVQTGLSLTESSRETKGQSWIGKRDSSTNLAGTPVEGYFDPSRRTREGRTPRSGRATPARSRVGSRATSRNVSRNASRSRLGTDLKMTKSENNAEEEERAPSAGASFATAPESDDRIREEEEDDELENVEPNWADAKTQAEMAAHLQAELGKEYDEDDGDPYGMLNFDGQGDNDSDGDSAADEEAVKKSMRSWGVGGWNWMDGAIDALMMVEEGSSEKTVGSRRESLQFTQDIESGSVEGLEGEGKTQQLKDGRG